MTRSWPPGATLLARLMNCCGGYLNQYGDYSTAQIAAGLNYTYGGWADGNSPSDIENSKLVVLFGNNPAETRMSGGGVTYYLEQAREKSNAKMIVIDPVIPTPQQAVKMNGSHYDQALMPHWPLR